MKMFCAPGTSCGCHGAGAGRAGSEAESSPRWSNLRHKSNRCGIDRDLHQTLAAATEVRGIGQVRVDDEFAAVVVGADGEANFVVGELAETSRDRFRRLFPSC